MKIAIDESPLTKRHNLAHRVRGTGFYIENLKSSLEKYYSNNSYIYFTQKQNIPKNTDLVHYPYFEPFFLSLPIINSFPTVVTIHDLTPLVFPKYFPSGLKGAMKWNIQKWLLKKVDLIITDSESSKKDIILHTGISFKKIHVVYLAASEEFQSVEKYKNSNEIRKKYNLPPAFVLYVGDVTWNKNLPRLLQATQKADIPLVMVGKALKESNFDKTNPWNRDLSLVQELADKNPNVLRLGFIPNEDIVALYQQAKAFVMPSLYEGFGLPILEAMSCGCPIVTTREGSIPEVVGDSALFVDAYDVDSIASGIKKVVTDMSLQEKLREKGLKQKENFSWEKTAQETVAVYEKVVLLHN